MERDQVISDQPTMVESKAQWSGHSHTTPGTKFNIQPEIQISSDAQVLLANIVFLKIDWMMGSGQTRPE